MSLEYGKLQPTNGRDWLGSLGHPSKFQRVSRLGFVTAVMSLNGGQPNFARCLAVFWAGKLYLHFWGLLPLMEFCQVQNSLCIQVLHSPILAVLLHGISSTAFNRGRHLYIREGGHHVGHRPTFKFEFLLWNVKDVMEMVQVTVENSSIFSLTHIR